MASTGRGLMSAGLASVLFVGMFAGSLLAGPAHAASPALDVSPVDVVVLADESGSLSSSAVKQEQAAAALIAQSELSSRSTVTILGFGSSNGPGQSAIDEICPMTEVTDNLARTALSRCVGKIKPRTEGKDTDFAAALRAAVATLTASPANRPRLVFLLTDGVLDVQNSPSYGPDAAGRTVEAQRQLTDEILPAAKQAGVQIWPLGFGAANRERLAAFAAAGSPVRAGCGSATAGSPPAQVVTDMGQVATSVLHAFAAARCAELSKPSTGLVSPGGSVDLEVEVPPIATDGSIVVNKLDSRLQVTYSDPEGQQVPSDGAVNGSTFTSSGRGGPIEALHIMDPKPGTWTVHVESPAGVPAQVVSASVLWQGAVRASVIVSPANPKPGQQVSVHVRLSRRSGISINPSALAPLRFAATLSGDGFSPLQVVLNDKGVAPDGVAVDGENSGSVTIPSSATGALTVIGVVTGLGVAGDERPWYGRVLSPGAAPLTVTVVPLEGTVTPGSTITTTVTASNGGEAQNVRVALSGLPAGVLVTVNPASMTLPSGRSEQTVSLRFDKATRRDAPGGQLTVTDSRGTLLSSSYLNVGVHARPWLLYGAILAVIAAAVAWLLLHLRKRRMQVRGLTATLLSAEGTVIATATAPRSGKTFALRAGESSLTTVPGTPRDAIVVRRARSGADVTIESVKQSVALGGSIPLPRDRTLIVKGRQPSVARQPTLPKPVAVSQSESDLNSYL